MTAGASRSMQVVRLLAGNTYRCDPKACNGFLSKAGEAEAVEICMASNTSWE
jgi:hypothetical protein